MGHNSAFFFILMGRFGWLGNWLFLFIALAECFPFFGAFFPGGTLISIGGFFAAQGYFSLEKIIIFSIIGAFTGDYLSFSLGRWGAAWLSKKNIVKAETIAKGEVFFQKYGSKSILWGRFFGATRAVIPFIAGASKMKQRTFLIWNLIGAITWSLFSACLGYFSGNILATIIRKWSHKLGFLLILMAAVWLIYWLVRKHGQSIIQYFKKQSQAFSDKLASSRLVNKLDKDKLMASELAAKNTSQEWLFGIFLWVVALATLYILTMFLDLFK